VVHPVTVEYCQVAANTQTKPNQANDLGLLPFSTAMPLTLIYYTTKSKMLSQPSYCNRVGNPSPSFVTNKQTADSEI